MTDYQEAARRGREEARRRSLLAKVEVVSHVWREVPVLAGRWVEPCPPFLLERQWRVEPVGTRWFCEAVGACGHVVGGEAGEPDRGVPAGLAGSHPVGSSRRCWKCLPRDDPGDAEAAAPPDEERCVYDSEGGEEVGWRRCRTRARWRVVHEAPGGVREDGVWPRVCEKHRRALIRSGHLLPEPLPVSGGGYSDGGWDVVEEIPRRR